MIKDECPKCGKKGIRGTKPHRCHWTTKPKLTSISTRQKTLSKGFGMYVDERLTPLRYRYNKYHTPFWRSK